MFLNSLTMVAVNPPHLLLMATTPAWMCLLHRPPTEVRVAGALLTLELRVYHALVMFLAVRDLSPFR
jgi:hypothetical protein